MSWKPSYIPAIGNTAPDRTVLYIIITPARSYYHGPIFCSPRPVPCARGWGGRGVITPLLPVDGTILPGITLASCLILAADHAFCVYTVTVAGSSAGVQSMGTCLHPTECAFTMHDLIRWSTDGTLLEVFCPGAVAIVGDICHIGLEG